MPLTFPSLADNTQALIHGASIIDCYVLCNDDEADKFGEQALTTAEFLSQKFTVTKPILVSSAMLNRILNSVSSIETRHGIEGEYINVNIKITNCYKPIHVPTYESNATVFERAKRRSIRNSQSTDWGMLEDPKP